MRVVFHGDHAATFREGFEATVGLPCEIRLLSDETAGLLSAAASRLPTTSSD